MLDMMRSLFEAIRTLFAWVQQTIAQKDAEQGRVLTDKIREEAHAE